MGKDIGGGEGGEMDGVFISNNLQYPFVRGYPFSGAAERGEMASEGMGEVFQPEMTLRRIVYRYLDQPVKTVALRWKVERKWVEIPTVSIWGTWTFFL